MSRAKCIEPDRGLMGQKQGSFWRRHRWLTVFAIVSISGLVVLTAAMAFLAHRFQPLLRASLVQGLQDKFQTRVELDDFHVALGNGFNGEWGIWATGRGLRIWPPQRTGGDRPLEISVQSIPLISLDEFRFHAPLRYERGKPIRISRVRLIGLKIDVPPRSERDKSTGFESALTKQKPSLAGSARGRTQGPQSEGEPANQTRLSAAPVKSDQSGGGMLSNVVVERIDCERALLILETNKPNKLPLGFDIARLELRDVSAQRPMKYEAELTNPKPKG